MILLTILKPQSCFVFGLPKKESGTQRFRFLQLRKIDNHPIKKCVLSQFEFGLSIQFDVKINTWIFIVLDG